jgi:hypothetical protein
MRTNQISVIHKAKRTNPRPFYPCPIISVRISTYGFLRLAKWQTQLRNGQSTSADNAIVLRVCRSGMHGDDMLDCTDMHPVNFQV